MTPRPDIRGRSFVERALAGVEETGPEWFTPIRQAAREAALEHGFPTRKHEEWRFLSLTSLLDFPFETGPSVAVTLADIESRVLPEARESRLVFVDGRFSEALSNTAALGDKVVAGPFKDILDEQNFAGQAHLGHRAEVSRDVFTALNTAHLGHGAAVFVAPDAELEVPVHLLYVSTGTAPAATHPRTVIVARRRAAATVIEEHMGLAGAPYFTNAVTEVSVAPSARLKHVMVQREGQGATHINRTAVFMCNDATYQGSAITLGAKLSRHNITVEQGAPGMHVELDGLVVLSGQQVADTHSELNHATPHGNSRQVHKCIVDGEAHAIFNGKVLVAEGAQQTNADQLNRNLLLTRKARVDTKPQLEIFADDVRCTHGTTIGQLDDEQIFYLQSRGFDRASATALLTYGFGAEVIERLPVTSLRDALRDEIAKRFGARLLEKGGV